MRPSIQPKPPWLLMVLAALAAFCAIWERQEPQRRLPAAECDARIRAFNHDVELEHLVFNHAHAPRPQLSGAAPDVLQTRVTRGEVVTLEPGAVLIDGYPFEHAALKRLLRGSQSDLDRLPLQVLAIRDVTWHEVVALVNLAESVGVERAEFFFEGPSDPPRVSLSDEWLVSMVQAMTSDRIDDNYNGTVARRMAWVGALAPACSRRGLLAELMTPSDPERIIPAFLQQCGCSVDPDLIRFLFHQGSSPGAPWTHIYIGGSARLVGETPRDVAFPASARWDDVAADFMKTLRESNAPVNLIATGG